MLVLFTVVVGCWLTDVGLAMVDWDSAGDCEAFSDLALCLFGSVGECLGPGFALGVGVGEYDDL